MKMNKTAAWTVVLAAAPALALAQASDADFSAQIGRAHQLIQQEQRLGTPGVQKTTQETGPKDPILLAQSPLINLIKKVEPSTVFLMVSMSASAPHGAASAEKGKTALCSGFFVEARPYSNRLGMIATNSHCVEMKAVGDEIQIGLYDGNDNRPKMLKGRVLAYGDSGAAKDVAFVELQDQNQNRPALPLWNKLDVGEQVVAIGNPRGFAFSVSHGIVSALDRDHVESQFVLSADQTDAAVNPGNSGGPLFNMWGSVVGINAMIVSESGGFEGISFTVPARYVAEGIKQYTRTGDLKIGSLQIMFGPDKDTKKLTIQKVVKGGPAASANVLAKDELVRIDGVDLEAMDPADAMTEVVGHVKYMSPGEVAHLVVRRGGQLLDFDVTLGVPVKPAPDRPAWAPLEKPDPKAAPKKSGFETI
jgi:S1-C subfamily serine protease